MSFKMVLQNDIVNEAGLALPVVLGKWRGKGKIEGKIIVLFFKSLKEIRVKNLLPGACPIPKADPASRLFIFQQMAEMSPQRSHASAATDVDHFLVSGFDVEIAERADGIDRVTFFQGVEIT